MRSEQDDGGLPSKPLTMNLVAALMRPAVDHSDRDDRALSPEPAAAAGTSRGRVVYRRLATTVRAGPVPANQQLDLLDDADEQLVDAVSERRRDLGVLAAAQLTRVCCLCRTTTPHHSNITRHCTFVSSL